MGLEQSRRIRSFIPGNLPDDTIKSTLAYFSCSDNTQKNRSIFMTQVMNLIFYCTMHHLTFSTTYIWNVLTICTTE